MRLSIKTKLLTLWRGVWFFTPKLNRIHENRQARMSKKCLVIVAVLCVACDLYAGNITFADSNVKALCVSNWDDNGDGEMSTEEAAAVTELGTVFKENKNIVTFEELQYFTGLTSIDEYAFYKSTIQTVVFPASVTAIGEYAFSQSNIRGELHIPGTVKEICHYAFYSCRQLTAVILEEGVQTVGWHCFSGPIRTLSLPSTLTFMYSMVIDPYVNADPSAGIFLPDGDLYVYAHGTVPAAINDYAFYYVFNDAHLVVPYGTVDVYKAVNGWSHFGEYLEFGDVNMDGMVNGRDVISTRAYVLGNNPSPFNEMSADINGDGSVNGRDVIMLRNIIMGQ